MNTGLEVVRQERARMEQRIEELEEALVTAYAAGQADERVRWRMATAQMEADNAKLREQVSSMHTVAGMVAESGGDSLTMMARDWQAEVKHLREQLPDDEANSDRYYRGFNDGYEYARRQQENDE